MSALALALGKYSCSAFSVNFADFLTNLLVSRQALNFSPTCAGGMSFSQFTTAFHCFVLPLGSTTFFPLGLSAFHRSCFLDLITSLLAITISVKLWSDELRGQRILIRTDNQNTELTINTGHFRIPFIQSRLRELWFFASLFDFELCALHIPGQENAIAELLS